jgi:hypothetical protein
MLSKILGIIEDPSGRTNSCCVSAGNPKIRYVGRTFSQ